MFESLCLKLQLKRDIRGEFKGIITNHAREFDNEKFVNFCNICGICHEFSFPKTPLQNEVVKRKT